MSAPVRPELPADIALRVRKAKAAGNSDAQIEAKLRQKYGVGLDAVPFADVQGGSSSADAKPFDYGIGNALAQGMSFGWSDELRAKEMEARGEGPYAENLRRIRAGQAAFRDRHPWVNGLTEVTGAVLSAVGAGKLIPALAKPVVGGAAIGAGYGAGTAEEGHRLEGAGEGAVIGAALPAAVGVASKAAPVVKAALGGAGKAAVTGQPILSGAASKGWAAWLKQLGKRAPVEAAPVEAAEAAAAKAPRAAVPPEGGYMQPHSPTSGLGSPLDMVPPPSLPPPVPPEAGYMLPRQAAGGSSPLDFLPAPVSEARRKAIEFLNAPRPPAGIAPALTEAVPAVAEAAAPVVAEAAPAVAEAVEPTVVGQIKKAVLSPADRAARTAWLKGMTETELEVATQKAMATGDASMQRSILRELKRRAGLAAKAKPAPVDQDLEALLRASLR